MLCTVRLSRRLFPDADGHGLDALIRRHALPVADRHRALGDARAIWAFIQTLYRDLPRANVDGAIKRLLRIPSLPPQLAPDALDALPEAPGVYLFYGDNPLPLYIGKSINLRERVGAHFSQDWRSETDLRLVAGDPPHRVRGDRRRTRRAAARIGARQVAAAGAQPRAAAQGGSGRSSN